jgi:small GTP-binding protein
MAAFAAAAVPMYTLLVWGAGGVGKTSLTLALIQQSIYDYDPTIDDSYRKQIMVDDQYIVLDVWDTATQEQETTNGQIGQAQGYLLIFSLTDRSSFDQIPPLREKLLQARGGTIIPMVLVGNKSDLNADRQVSSDEAEALASKWQMPYLEISAKKRLSSDLPFVELARLIHGMNARPLTPQPAAKRGNSLQKCNMM